MVRGTAGSWPRISPAAFLRVWTFTYVRPDSSANRTEAFTVAVPLAPLVHGAQRGTTTGPGVPGAPMWMCAAAAGPVRLLNESCQFSTVPESDFVSVAVKLPVAEPTSPFGAGTSSEAAIVAPM